MSLKCLIQSFEKLIHRLQSKDNWQLQSIKQKDILTLEEASLYLRIPPGVLLEEVGLGYIPGGFLAGEWRFYKEALLNHFSIYHGSGPWINYGTVDEELEVVKEKTVSRLIKDYKRGKRDFTGNDLRGADLKNTELIDADFSGCWLSRANFEGSFLKDADFQEAHLRKTNFQGADLSYANFKGADLTEADLSRAILVGANLENAILLGINLESANLENAKFR